jgi:phosphohistidine phosphatase
MYEASTLGLVMLVRELPDDATTVMFVGHNPGTAELADGLADAGLVSFPTAAVAVLAVDGPWASAAPGQARLLEFVTPATL